MRTVQERELFVYKMAASEDESKGVYEGHLYTVEQRLETFKGSHWPYDSGTCTPLKMAEAGFYYCGTPVTPDWVRCVVCHHEMDGWEETDKPLEEHQTHKPSCPFIKRVSDPYAITVGDVLELEREAIKFFVKNEVERLRESLAYTWETLEMALHETLDNMSD